MKIDDEIELNTESELADCLGSILINFALLEHYLEEFLSRILNLTPLQRRYLATPLQPRAMIENIRAITKEIYDIDKYKKLNESYKKAEEVIKIRNKIAHGHFVIHPDQKLSLKTFKGKNPKPIIEKLDTGILAHNAVHTLVLAKEFQSLAANFAKTETM